MPRELVHTGRKIQVFVDTMTARDGSVIRRDVIQHPGAVVILPVIDAEHICLLRNRRWVVAGSNTDEAATILSTRSSTSVRKGRTHNA